MSNVGTSCDGCFLWAGLLVIVHEIRNDPGHPNHGAATEKRLCVDCVLAHRTVDVEGAGV